MFDEMDGAVLGTDRFFFAWSIGDLHGEIRVSDSELLVNTPTGAHRGLHPEVRTCSIARSLSGTAELLIEWSGGRPALRVALGAPGAMGADQLAGVVKALQTALGILDHH